MKKILGKGAEGIAYHVYDQEDHREMVVKIFHESRTSDWLPGLLVYADKVMGNDLGLPDIELLLDRDEIIGLSYPFVQLNSLHWRVMDFSDEVAKSVVGSYCQKQYYLIQNHQLALCDAGLYNFKVDRKGRWHYVDMGVGICLLDDPRVMKHGEIGYGFADMLLTIYRESLNNIMTSTDKYSYDEPCLYCRHESLNVIASQHPWVKEILDEIRGHKASIFYDPEFYRRLSERLPNQIPWPFALISLSKVLSSLGRHKGRFHFKHLGQEKK